MVVQKVDNETLAFRFPALDKGKAEEVRTHLLDAQKQGITHIILDVRDCGRGDASEAYAISRMFISSGKLGELKGQTVSNEVFSADRRGG